MELDNLLEIAILETAKIHIDDGEFLVRDLFKGYEWKRIGRNKRLRLGILFLNSVECNKVNNTIKTTKTSSKQQKYKKIK